MNPGLFGLWLLVGWCGTPWPRRWPWPRPDPPPWWLQVVGAVGGIIGGWAYQTMWPAGDMGVGALYAAATSVGALVGSIILQDVVGLATGGAQR